MPNVTPPARRSLEDAGAGLTMVRRQLRRLRARRGIQRGLEDSSVFALVAAGVLVGRAAVNVWLPGIGPRLGWAGVAGVLIPMFSLLALRAWQRRGDLAATAREIDRRAGTRDRFATTLALAGRGGDFSPVEALAWEECTRFAQVFPVARWTPFALPRTALFLPVPLLTLAFLLLRPPAPVAGDANPASQRTITAQADELQRAADLARRAEDRRLAEELDRAAARLREAAAVRRAGEGENPAQRAALRELSDLGARLRAMAAARPSGAELAALAAALEREGSDAARAAAQALRRGDVAEAGRQLEALLEQLKQRGDAGAAALAQLARSLKEQAEKLTDAQRGEVARQMQAAAEGKQASELLRKISELLRQAGGAQAGNRGGRGGGGQDGAGSTSGNPGGGRQLTTQQLQALLNALEKMKDGLRDGRPDPGGDRGPGGGGLMLAMEDFARAGQNPAPGGNPSAGVSGGGPGSERDVGTTENIFDARPAGEVAKTADRATRLSGTLGEGESLQDFAPSSDPGAPARAGRRYREIYEAMEPAAQEAVRQENIPLGSRFLVERYFKNIRPPE